MFQYVIHISLRAGLRSGTQLGTISVGPGSQSTCTKVCTCIVLDKLRVDCTLAQGTLRHRAQLGAIGPIDLRPALLPNILLEDAGGLHLHITGPLLNCFLDPPLDLSISVDQKHPNRTSTNHTTDDKQYL